MVSLLFLYLSAVKAKFAWSHCNEWEYQLLDEVIMVGANLFAKIFVPLGNNRIENYRG